MTDTEELQIHWVKYLTLKIQTMNVPVAGRRRAWVRIARLEKELADAKKETDRLTHELDLRVSVVDSTLTDLNQAYATIESLGTELAIAIGANAINSRRTDFSFSDRPITPYVDQATYPIDVRDLRASLENEPIMGKVTQPNPDTGEHETVETGLDQLSKAARTFLVRRFQGNPGLIYPTFVPGMKVS